MKEPTKKNKAVLRELVKVHPGGLRPAQLDLLCSCSTRHHLLRLQEKGYALQLPDRGWVATRDLQGQPLKLPNGYRWQGEVVVSASAPKTKRRRVRRWVRKDSQTAVLAKQNQAPQTATKTELDGLVMGLDPSTRDATEGIVDVVVGLSSPNGLGKALGGVRKVLKAINPNQD